MENLSSIPGLSSRPGRHHGQGVGRQKVAVNGVAFGFIRTRLTRRNVIVENTAGAAGTLGTKLVAKAASDGPAARGAITAPVRQPSALQIQKTVREFIQEAGLRSTS